MFNDPGPRSLCIRVIDCCISLEIRCIKKFCLKSYRTVFQISHLIVKVCIDRSCVNHLIGKCIPLILFLKIVFLQTDFNALQHIRNHLRISTHRNSLIQCIKIIVIKGQTHRQSLDDKGRKLLTASSPLLLCISFDQFFEDISSHKGNSLFFEILWLCDTCFTLLLFNLGSGLLWCYHTPHFIESIHIKRKGIQFSMIIRYRAVCKTIKLRKLCDIIPYFFVVGMKDMCTIFMHMNLLYIFCIYISSNVWTLVDNKY